jgi:DNA-binding beta-propeller fold protein YncE
MAIDFQTHRLFTSCLNGRLLVVNADTGKLVATLPIGNGTDAAAFDPKRKRIFSSNADGTISVIAEKSADKFVVLGTIKTALGAKTMTVDPNTGRLFLVMADTATVRTAKQPGELPQFTYIPGSEKLLVFSPRP